MKNTPKNCHICDKEIQTSKDMKKTLDLTHSYKRAVYRCEFVGERKLTNEHNTKGTIYDNTHLKMDRHNISEVSCKSYFFDDL